MARAVRHASDEAIAEAASALKQGGLVAFPTETVYGLGALHTHHDAVARIFLAKQRPSNHPLVLHADSTEMARALVAVWTPEAQALADAFWPGPLTMVLPRASQVSHAVTGGLDTAAVRVPASSVALALIRAAGGAIAAPSANPYQGISPTTADHVRSGLGDRVDMILDGGPCARGLESTIVDVASQTLLRLGPISAVQLRAFLPALRVAESFRNATDDGVHLSPGMSAKHYAPRARLRVMSVVAMSRETANVPTDHAMWLTHSVEPPAGHGLRLPGHAEEYGALLYAALHTLDALNAREIWVEEIPEHDSWDAMRDRLQRAAH